LHHACTNRVFLAICRPFLAGNRILQKNSAREEHRGTGGLDVPRIFATQGRRRVWFSAESAVFLNGKPQDCSARKLRNGGPASQCYAISAAAAMGGRVNRSAGCFS
jgi:hypothetical protein